ncbi:monovalent cation/H+ antiporter subunit D [Bradyrhizobium sp. WBOS7]|uniref:Monovalent cation/H+ antiporter subunit D n=1 Tax=Bradyrhizobium betae TaxID=244734 RepID=A0AAE9NE58_9BRAD|nr:MULTISPECIES: monovalent cation/H+ antiporter subunit D [Bradyrhizobium]MDD1570056.1 monovalent cation/H+ antiporter subunit D [Bradyrhizobium sp. WBOS1]UUO36790.1 monovalent cation/H+ antiporter subunit D [Bradyrhizobium sp. WBOS01]MDD1525793.1 monovalent cation/H+ antiporter subunit D [Bradyrhizobium sp. WBOS2]MDD1576676.1 monovalent cation/H+ antiporter subunit D [Bradyrhizobium sp. WBOS7]MDD1598988.1 monovalent cation/H+ antiporter subunit D [Bradyrhizobium sp. WBOS16]
MSGAAGLVIAPIILPLLAGAGMLLLNGEKHRTIVAGLNVAGTLALVWIAAILLGLSDSGSRIVYRLGNWPAPFGIVLVLDRLSALMLMLSNVLALASAVFSLARWHRAGAHFHSLFQFLLMGLNGAFLTGDLFNLFVFFELLLAASYGLLLHGSGLTRVKAGLHYVVVNLAASLLFLIGVSLIYGVTGTLNMADLAARMPQVAAESRGLLEAGAGVLAVAFLLKAGMWPLSFWLPTAYAAATPPVASIFAIMTKVGVYVVLRLSLLLFGEGTGASAGFGSDWLLWGGLATILFGAIGTLASQDTARLGGFSVLVSSGTLLAATGMGQVGVTGGALFYLVSSTLGISAFFLLIELIERGREPGADVIAVTREAYGEEVEVEETDENVGIAIVATMAWLGVAFIGCALVIAGLPPLSGFIAKFALLAAALDPAAVHRSGTVPGSAWAFLVVLILSGLATLIAMTRAGIRIFWASPDRTVPRVRLIEMAPIMFLLIMCAAQTVLAGPVIRFMQATAQSLHAPTGYVGDILETGVRDSRKADSK